MKYKLTALSVTALLVLFGWSFWHKSSMSMAEATQTVQLNDGQSYDLKASAVTKDLNGKSQRMLAYNNSIQGPTLEVKQGSKATINFKNELNTETAIHFHGIRNNNASDGVVGVTQTAIKPGGSYSYKLSFPDPGVYWYHPHLREDSSQPLGLYGTIIVKPVDGAYWSPVNKEVPLMIGDILMDKDKIAAFDKKQATYTLMGRFGNTMIVNGSANNHIFAQPGEVDRFYLTNVASVRPFKLAIPGVKFKLVGGDNGKYERETYVDSVTIGPSERAVIEALFDKTGVYELQSQTPDKTYKLTTITVAGAPVQKSYVTNFNNLRTNIDTITSIDPFRAAFSKAADKSLRLSVNMGMSGMGMRSDMPGMDMSGMNMSPDNNALEWEDTMTAMNKSSTASNVKWQLIDRQSGQQNQQNNWQFKKGQIVKLSIYNDPSSMHSMQHPIHIHGQRFLVTSVNGKPSTNLVWKDTVLVGKGDTTELLVDMSNPGKWVIHCHIPEHMESGMLLNYTVN